MTIFVIRAFKFFGVLVFQDKCHSYAPSVCVCLVRFSFLWGLLVFYYIWPLLHVLHCTALL